MENMIGKRFGKLLVMDQYYKQMSAGEQRDYCLCQCDCGSPLKEIMGKNLRRGLIISCRCYQKQQIINRSKKFNKYNLSGEYGIGYFSNSENYFYFHLDDYEKIKDFCWMEDNHGYAASKFLNKGKRITFQDLVMNNYDKNYRVDHIDRNIKDNRKNNLRLSTHQQNNINRTIASNNTSGVIGVSQEKYGWHSYLMIDGKRIHSKLYKNFDDAVKARLIAEKKYFKEFAPQQHLYHQYGIE